VPIGDIADFPDFVTDIVDVCDKNRRRRRFLSPISPIGTSEYAFIHIFSRKSEKALKIANFAIPFYRDPSKPDTPR